MALPQSFPPFSPSGDPARVGVRWEKWFKRLENMFTGFNITNDARKRALLLYYGGEELQDTFDTLPNTGDSYEDAKTALNTYFIAERNIDFEQWVFHSAKQQPDETIDAFHTRLRQLAATCAFDANVGDGDGKEARAKAAIEAEVRSQLISGCKSQSMRFRAWEKKLTLEQILTQERASEISQVQAAKMNDAQSVNAMHSKSKQKHSRKTKSQSDKSAKKCWFCGDNYPHESTCPAKGKTCDFCGKPNHFASVCHAKSKSQKGKQHLKDNSKKQHARNLEAAADTCNSDSSGSEYSFACETGVNKVVQPQVSIKVDGVKHQFLVDTGTTVNIMSHATFQKLSDKPKLCQTDTKIYPYGQNKPLDIVGQFNACLSSKHNSMCADIYVVKEYGYSLLSYTTSTELGLIHISSHLQPDIVNDFKDVLVGKSVIGKLNDRTVKLHIDETIPGVIQPHRRIPFHMRKSVEQELARMLQLDIIEKVESGPTPWVSPIHPVPKKDPAKKDVRITVDMRGANKAILRERHVMPTIDDIISNVNGAKIFSKLDLNSGYHQLEIDPESRYITTFSTHKGLFRYKRLTMGVNSAAEIFQHTISSILSDIPNVINISDDILIHATTKEEHDATLRAVLTRLREKNLTLNAAKCEIGKSSITFYGYNFSDQGMALHPQKVSALLNASPPESPEAVRSLLGLATYCSKFIPNYAVITEPLRRLTRKDVPWSWGEEEEKAFVDLKDALCSDLVVAYFDPLKDTELYVDASPGGLAAILTQHVPNKPDTLRVIAHGSRALTPTEQRYSQTEREALAITWAVTHFHLYIFGKPCTVITDHKPLVPLFNEPYSKPTPRIERWILRLQEYELKVVYKPGKGNPADFMSRHPVGEGKTKNVAENYVNFIVENTLPKTLTFDQVCNASRADPAFNLVVSAVRNGRWHESIQQSMNPDITTFVQAMYKRREELTVTDDDMILRNHRLVIPNMLQKHCVELAHEGHQGETKTKRLLREKVWFPGIDKLVRELCDSCVACQAAVVDNRKDPVEMTNLPPYPWAEVSLDFCDLPNGEHLLVIVDDYSRFPIVEVIHSNSAKTVIPILDKTFSIFGVPEVVRSDNGPPFKSAEFKQFAQYLGFRHRRVTPYWPRANGEVERFMRTLKKTLRTACHEGKSWRQTMYRFLRNYRATPHSTTCVAPSTVMFGRPMRTRIPEYPVGMNDRAFREVDEANKAKMKTNADKHNKGKPDLTTGDPVLVKKQGYVDKFSDPYQSDPFTVVASKGSMVTAENSEQEITRNHLLKGDHVKTKPPEVTANKHREEEETFAPQKPPQPSPMKRPQRDRRPPSHLNEFVRS